MVMVRKREDCGNGKNSFHVEADPLSPPVVCTLPVSE